jgi:hypothetical protein
VGPAIHERRTPDGLRDLPHEHVLLDPIHLVDDADPRNVTHPREGHGALPPELVEGGTDRFQPRREGNIG